MTDTQTEADREYRESVRSAHGLLCGLLLSSLLWLGIVWALFAR